MCNLHTHSPTMFHVRSRDLLFAQKYISEGRFCFDEKLSGCSSQRCYFLVLKHQSKDWHIYCQGSMFVQAIRVPWLYGNYISILKMSWLTKNFGSGQLNKPFLRTNQMKTLLEYCLTYIIRILPGLGAKNLIQVATVKRQFSPQVVAPC